MPIMRRAVSIGQHTAGDVIMANFICSVIALLCFILLDYFLFECHMNTAGTFSFCNVSGWKPKRIRFSSFGAGIHWQLTNPASGEVYPAVIPRLPRPDEVYDLFISEGVVSGIHYSVRRYDAMDYIVKAYSAIMFVLLSVMSLSCTGDIFLIQCASSFFAVLASFFSINRRQSGLYNMFFIFFFVFSAMLTAALLRFVC